MSNSVSYVNLTLALDITPLHSKHSTKNQCQTTLVASWAGTEIHKSVHYIGHHA